MYIHICAQVCISTYISTGWSLTVNPFVAFLSHFVGPTIEQFVVQLMMPINIPLIYLRGDIICRYNKGNFKLTLRIHRPFVYRSIPNATRFRYVPPLFKSERIFLPSPSSSFSLIYPVFVYFRSFHREHFSSNQINPRMDDGKMYERSIST